LIAQRINVMKPLWQALIFALPIWHGCALVLQNMRSATDAEIYSSRMLRSINEPLHLMQSTVSANASCTLPTGAVWCSAFINAKQRKLAVYSGPDPVSNTICGSGSWEFASVHAMGIMEPGADKTFVDIGANVGWFSVLFADAGYKVLAVEPMAANRDLLKASLCQNPDLAARVEIVPVALAQKPTKKGQTCDIYSCDCNLGDGLLVCDGEEARRKDIVDNPHFNHVFREKVGTRTLDEFMKDHGSPAIHAIKMDVEGYECKVLEGGADTFRKSSYTMAEVRDNTAPCIMAPLKKNGFVAHRDDFAGAIMQQYIAGGVLSNLFFARK
jgi:FkbM family methyltransferase